MANSLVSFLERRKKSAVKASTLLQKTEEEPEEEPAEPKVEDEQEVQSEQEDEWRVSSDESDDLHHATNFAPNLVKVVHASDNGEVEEGAKESQERKTQQVWSRMEEPAEEPEPVEEKPKVWVPKFREEKNLLNSKNDVGLAESVKMFAKGDALGTRKKKKNKAKSSQEFEEEDEFSFVKVKFDAFSLLDPEYSVFESAKPLMNEELVRSKYMNRHPKVLGVS